VTRILAEIDADDHRQRLARLHADEATIADALILWDELENPGAMVADVEASSFEEGWP
jgi:hypothetical protein